MLVFSLASIAKTYASRVGDVRALADVSFEVRRGERVCVLGPSGAGKSSLLRILNATLRPTSGAVRAFERDVGAMSGAELRATRRRIGTIFQRPELVPSRSALVNALAGRLGHWSLGRTLASTVRPAAGDIARAERALEAVGLSDKRDARADELSGGQQQRVSIARMLVQEPDVILADEPFASLDPALTDDIAQLLVRLAGESRRTLFATLHDTDLALRWFERIIAMKGGRVVFDLPVSDVSPEHLEALYATAPPGGSPAPEG